MKILVLLAEGFEEIEALTVVDYLRRLDINVNTVSMTENEKVVGAHDIGVITDVLFQNIEDLESYDGLVLPGGLPGATNLRDDKRVIDLVQDFNNREKLVAAICAGPIVLEKAGIIAGKDITSYPGFEDQLSSGNYKEDKVVVDGNIITGRGPALAMDFTIEIAKYLLDEQSAEDLKEDILYRFL